MTTDLEHGKVDTNVDKMPSQKAFTAGMCSSKNIT